jgi:hypothetical protein
MAESKPKRLDLSDIVDEQSREGGDSALIAKIAAIENENLSIKDKLQEERFIWIIISMVLFGAIIFPHMSTWSAPLVIGIIQFIGLFVLAQRCGVNSILPLMDRILGAVGSSVSRGKEG